MRSGHLRWGETPGQAGVETYISTTQGRVRVDGAALGSLCGFRFCLNSTRYLLLSCVFFCFSL